MDDSGDAVVTSSRPLARKVVKRKLTKPRSRDGAAEAKAAATMTSEEWRESQQGLAEKWPQPPYMAVQFKGMSATIYRDETYEIITRWMAETKIEYRPHAKSPGSKSHVRYEAYSKAKTVGQALNLGSIPQDWCWDYERGFIKVLGPLRDDPIDISAHTEGDAPLTEVDRCIYRWYNKELSKKLGVDYYSLFGSTDGSSILRAHRLVAQREARKRLADAEAAGRKISDEDVAAVLKNWAFVKNAARANVIPDGGSWVWSDTAGMIRDRGGSIHVTPFTRLYPEVIEVIVKYLTDRLPEECANFKFTSINLNCNYAARLHRDGNNFGPSCIKAFGDFTGGELNYWPEDDKSLGLEDIPPTEGRLSLQIGPGADGGLALFNGNSCHSVNDFEGDRFSIVYFTIGCHDRAPQEEKDFLTSVGIPVPAVDEDPRLLLRAPIGIANAVGRDSAKGNPPSVRFLPNAQLEKMKAKPRVTTYVELLEKTPVRKGQGMGRKAAALEQRRKAAEAKASKDGKKKGQMTAMSQAKHKVKQAALKVKASQARVLKKPAAANKVDAPKAPILKKPAAKK